MFRFVCIISTFFILVYAYASELGDFGNSFAIEEIPFQQMIINKLKKVNMSKFNADMEKIIRNKVVNPDPPIGIGVAKQSRTFRYDPSYIAKQDIISPTGVKLYSKGQKVNPLNYMDFDRKLYFIDGDSEKQIEWFKRQVWRKQRDEYRLVVVKGPIPRLALDFNISVYFDQNGSLLSHFGIKHIPAIVWQRKDESLITVKEVCLRY